MPSLGPLRRLLPYYTPYRKTVAAGLLLVVGAAGAAATRAVAAPVRHRRPARRQPHPWSSRGSPPPWSAPPILSGALRFGMRELLNGVSRWIEYDLRNDLFGHLTTLDAA